MAPSGTTTQVVQPQSLVPIQITIPPQLPGGESKTIVVQVRHVGGGGGEGLGQSTWIGESADWKCLLCHCVISLASQVKQFLNANLY